MRRNTDAKILIIQKNYPWLFLLYALTITTTPGHKPVINALDIKDVLSRKMEFKNLV